MSKCAKCKSPYWNKDKDLKKLKKRIANMTPEDYAHAERKKRELFGFEDVMNRATAQNIYRHWDEEQTYWKKGRGAEHIKKKSGRL